MTKKTVKQIRRQYREVNRQRKDYFLSYYSGERYEKQKEDTLRTRIMNLEAGYLRDSIDIAKKTKENLIKKGLVVFVDGKKYVEYRYAVKNLIKNISWPTINQYLAQYYIPQPPFKIPYKKGYKKYYSMYQIRLINTCWPKTIPTKTLEERVKNLHVLWKNKSLLGGESIDRNTD